MSHIFSNSELAAIEKRMSGDMTDKHGTFHGRVKPKIKEMFEVWIPRSQELAELVRKRR